MNLRPKLFSLFSNAIFFANGFSDNKYEQSSKCDVLSKFSSHLQGVRLSMVRKIILDRMSSYSCDIPRNRCRELRLSKSDFKAHRVCVTLFELILNNKLLC